MKKPEVKTTEFLTTAAVILAGLVAIPSANAQHLNAGALGHNQGDALTWANGAAFAASSGYVQNLTYTNGGRYAGLYQGNISFTALAADPSGPGLGSFIEAEIVSVSGPAGGFFAFWEGADQGGGDQPFFNIATGSTDLSLRYALSDVTAGAGQPGQDPFGHLHGRRFTASEPGTYTIGFRAVDTSLNGVDGGAIHTASDILFINFAAVPEPSAVALGLTGLAGFWWIYRRRKT